MAEKLLFALLVLISSAFGFDDARAKPVRVDAVEVELVADREAVVPGQPLALGLRIRHDPHWHTYWRNPGDSGLPTTLELTLPEGFSAGPIQWPAPQRLPVGPLLNFGFEGEIVLPVAVTVPQRVAPGEAKFTASAQWLVCKDVCIPGEARLSLSLPVQSDAARGASKWSSLFESMAARTPRGSLEFDADVLAGAPNGPSLLLVPAGPPMTASSSAAEFYPYASDWMQNGAAQRLLLATLGGGERPVLEVPLARGIDAEKLKTIGVFGEVAGVLVLDGQPHEVRLRAAPLASTWQGVSSVRGQSIAAAPSPAAAGSTPPSSASPTSSSSAVAPTSSGLPAAGGQGAGAVAGAAASAGDLSLVAALGFAFVGGLILNLMPCVFPVIGLKLLSFVGASRASSTHRLGHAMAFALGVLGAFWLLAVLMVSMRSAGQALGWGFQLQSPAFVMAMGLLFLAIGLNLSGLFEVGVPMSGLASKPLPQPQSGRSQHLGDVGAGVLAVLVATPCTAPFMGSALGFTLSQPLVSTLLVFTALGLGMAAPYVVLALQPAWAKRLPKPGRWMETLRQLLAFPMYATVTWLVWVLVQQSGGDAVLEFGIAAILVALSAWIYGRFVQRGERGARWAAGLAFICLVAALARISELPASDAQSSSGAAAPGRTSGQPGATWQPWSTGAVDQALAEGRPVFVDFTAAWCVSCQANKKLVLERDAVLAAFRERGVVLLRADWTSRNPAISDALAAFGRNGVPLYVLYSARDRAPQLLPELLTQSIVLDALSAIPRR